MPGHSTDSFPVEVVKCEGLLLHLHIPYSEKSTAATRYQDMWNFLVPVETIKVIRPGHLVAQHKRVGGIVEVPYVELCAGSAYGEGGVIELHISPPP